MTPGADEDAILWRAEAFDLLRAVPRDWWSKIARDLRCDAREYRKADDVADGYFPEIRACIIRPGLSILRAWGPQPFHVDLEFPRFNHLLILRGGHFRITGEAMGADCALPDRTGCMVCLDTHRFHAVLWRGHEQQPPPAVHFRPFSWAALALDSWTPLSFSQAHYAFAQALGFDARARSNLIDQILERAA